MSERERQPVIVGVAQINVRDRGAEPIALMSDVTRAVHRRCRRAGLAARLQSVQAVRGIWPYVDPARLVAERLGLEDVTTARTQIGGNEVYDLLTTTCARIRDGELDATVICAAETMRTRRHDHREGRASRYLPESDDAAPDWLTGEDRPMADDAQNQAGAGGPVSFYAMAETALAHRSPDGSLEAHLEAVAELWAEASTVAAGNPAAWIRDARDPGEILDVTADNRMVSWPYRKLMTSNVDVDMGAAVVVCSTAIAAELGVPRDRWVFPWGGAGATDNIAAGRRLAFDESPAMRLAGLGLLEACGVGTDDLDLIDLYSCFPVAVQVARRELDLGEDRPFTITGGLTFAGGPLNSYCMHALARAVDLLRAGDGTLALLTGNGGYFSKHSFALLGAEPPSRPYAVSRPQEAVDACGQRPVDDGTATDGVIEAYTVTYDRGGEAERAVLAVLTTAGARVWANNLDPAFIDWLIEGDRVGMAVTLDRSESPASATSVAVTPTR